jgi:predicted Zn-dependent protease
MPYVHQIRRSSDPSPGYDGLCLTRPWRRAGATVVAVLLICALLGACGSSSSTASSAEVKRTCKQVEAVLSDGPEPAADPVGYAQAQILPLRQIRTSDGKLQEAIHRLAAAYQAFSADNRIQHAANSAVTAAVHGVNALCPGAAS